MQALRGVWSVGGHERRAGLCAARARGEGKPMGEVVAGANRHRDRETQRRQAQTTAAAKGDM
jgi:hypothetical protein